MNDDPANLNFNKNVARQGFICQTIIALITIALSIWSQNPLLMILACFACSGIPIWFTIYHRNSLLSREQSLLTIDRQLEWVEEEIFQIQSSINGLHVGKNNRAAFCASVILIVGGGAIFTQFAKNGKLLNSPDILLLLAITGIFAFFVLITSFYFNQLLKTTSDKTYLTSGVQHFATLSIFLVGMILFLCGEYIRIPRVLFYGTMLFSSIIILLGIEILLKIVLQYFRPRTKDEIIRPAFESYLLELLKKPTQMQGVLADVVNKQLGFEASNSTFFHLLVQLALPFVLLSLILMFALSSIVIIAPSEKALVLHFGNVTDRVLEPGINLIAPWPINSVRKVNVWEVRRMYVGSLHPANKNGEIYKDGSPVLWTNTHGVTKEELLIVAPPSDLMAKTKSGGKSDKAPSISLAAVDVTVEYRINDIKSFITAAENPESYLKQIAEAELSLSLYSYDIDSFFCAGRIKLPGILETMIQRAADKAKLGIKVLNVGVGGVHPPQTVASAFEETVSAQQERETAIQLAKQYSIKNMIEAVGSIEETENILNVINNPEKSLLKNNVEILLHSSSGFVSEILSKAVAYRCERENTEKGKAERFNKKLLLYNSAPKAYLAGDYMSVLEKGLKNAKKYMIIGERNNLVLRFNFADLNAMAPAKKDFKDPILLEDRD